MSGLLTNALPLIQKAVVRTFFSTRRLATVASPFTPAQQSTLCEFTAEQLVLFNKQTLANQIDILDKRQAWQDHVAAVERGESVVWLGRDKSSVRNEHDRFAELVE